MKLSEYRKTYYEFSGKVSDVARHLAFAGIALIWIFKVGTKDSPRVPTELLPPSAFFVASLALDLLQYIAATCVWGVFQWSEERKLENVTDNPELDAPSWFKWPQFIFFVLKLVAVVIAYYFLTKHIWVTWFKT